MQPVIIIPDIHNRVAGIEAFLSKYPDSKVIFLGDYFDHQTETIVEGETKKIPDTPQDAANTAQWLKHSLQQPNRKHLIGNHDLPYLFPCRANKDHYCPGWTEEKHLVIAEHKLDNSQFLLAALEHNWLITHAGFSEEWIPSSWRYKYDVLTADNLELEINQQLPQLTNGSAALWITEPGTRLGRPTVGGIMWCHFPALKSPKGINQIVGHTGYYKPKTIEQDGCKVVGVDVLNTATLVYPDHLEFCNICDI